MLKRFSLLNLGLGLLASHATFADTLDLASPQKAPGTIVVPSATGTTVRFAAQELQKYVEQMTGIRLNIEDDAAGVEGPKVLLTSTASPQAQAEKFIPAPLRPPVGSDAFLIRTVGDTLVIAGGCDRAVLFGVYAWLERLGCRWFGPGEEYVPRMEAMEIPPLEVSEAPALKWRALELIAGSNAAVVDWMAKAKLNVAWPETYTPLADLRVSEESMKAAAVPAMIERGLTIFWGGHVLPLLFSSEKYADHPEYFAQIQGKRLDPAVDFQARAQLCTSNPEVLRILTENTVAFLRHHPWIDVLFLWGNDTTQWCECASCRALEPDPDKPSPFGGLDRSATYCRMIKVVNEGVQRELPGRKIAFNHYYNLEDLPSPNSGEFGYRVLPAASVLSAVDAYRQCDRHPFTDPNCPKGKRIEPLARMWVPHYPDSVSWSYYWSWNFMKGLPISMVHKIPEDFRFVRSLGLNGVVDNVSLTPANLLWLNNRLNFYVYGKAAWDPDLDADAVVADFIHHYYGPAAGSMAKFWRLMEETTTRFGMDPDFMPEDQTLADPNVVHGWMMDIRYLIPNRSVFDRAMGYLREALSHVASAHGEPLKPEYTPYAFRVQALESAIASWSPPPRDYEVFGFFNGGGQNTDHLYTDAGSVHGPVHCTVVSGNNRGDCFWVKPLGTEQLARVGDSVQVNVRINYGTEVVGEPLYRSGPGLYQAHEQTSPCGDPGAVSAMFYISNLNDDQSGPCRVLALACDGGYETALKSSADNVWTYGQAITLRIDYLGDTGGRHTYRYSYHTDTGWVEVGTFEFSVKLPFVAPMHKWGGYYNGTRTHYPVLNWATFDHFMVSGEW